MDVFTTLPPKCDIDFYVWYCATSGSDQIINAGANMEKDKPRCPKCESINVELIYDEPDVEDVWWLCHDCMDDFTEKEMDNLKQPSVRSRQNGRCL